MQGGGKHERGLGGINDRSVTTDAASGGLGVGRKSHFRPGPVASKLLAEEAAIVAELRGQKLSVGGSYIWKLSRAVGHPLRRGPLSPYCYLIYRSI